MSGTQYSPDIVQRGAALLERMLGDPRTAADAERLVQTINPEAQFPLRDQREALMAPVRGELERERKAREVLEARLAEREAREAAEAQSRQEAAMMDRIQSVKTKRGLSDEAMERVYARMREQNSPDVEAAAAYVADSLPKPGPQTGAYDRFLPQTVDPFGSTSGDEQWAALHKNPDGWLTDKLRSIAHDPEFARLGQQ